MRDLAFYGPELSENEGQTLYQACQVDLKGPFDLASIPLRNAILRLVERPLRMMLRRTIYVPFPPLRAFFDPWSVVIADPEAFALGSAAAELSHGVVGGLIVGLAVVSSIGEPAAVSVADAAEHQACVDIPVAFDVSIPVSLLLTGADSAGHPRFLAFPNIDLYASSSSSAEVAG